MRRPDRDVRNATMATSLVYDQRPDPVVRGLVTLGALVVLFLGTRIPLPGLSPDLLQRISGGAALGRLSIFALGVAPVIAALAIVELLRVSIPPFGRWAAASDKAARLDALARALALALAAIQANGVAELIERIAGFAEAPGWTFRAGIAATAIGATALLMWLGDLVTRNGFGDGLLILLAAPIVVQSPSYLPIWMELSRTGAIPISLPVAAVILTAVAIVLLIAASLAHGWSLKRLTGPNLAGARFEIWPPILAATVFGPLVALADHLSRAETLPRAVVAALHMGALAALIALFAILRARLASGADRPPNLWLVTFSEIVVCIGAMAFAYVYRISSASSGFSIVFVVAAALSCVSRYVRL
jgi:hypothetical protein